MGKTQKKERIPLKQSTNCQETALDMGHFDLETEIVLHIFTFFFCMACDVNIIAVVYSKTCFSTNINLALANTKIVINGVRFAILTVHLLLVQVRLGRTMSREYDLILFCPG